MDPKSGAYSSFYDDDEPAPPSYNEAQSTLCGKSTTSSVVNSQLYSTQIATQLQSITSAVTSLHTQKSLLAHAQDEKILSLLTQQIQIYISGFAESGLQRGTLILIPKKGLQDENALPCEYDFKDPEEYDKVVRVGDKESGDDLEEEENYWYWRDENMAFRLAGYLRPIPDPKPKELPPQEDDITAMQKKIEPSSSSRGLWGRKASSVKKEETRPLASESDRGISKTATSKESGDKVVMDVRAEEVVFRTENDFGIFETRSGWGIVLKLKLILGSG